jgi:branched-chain amino acid transport system permease protein
VNKSKWAVLAVVLLALMAPLFVYPVLLMKLLCFALFACALNLLLGYTGLLSLGHAAFFGGAGYATGVALASWGLPFELGILFGVVFAAGLGFVVGGLAIRRQGIYFAMITLALAQLVFFIVLQVKVLGGEDGLQRIPRGTLLGLIDLSSDRSLYYVILSLFLAGFWLIHRVIRSPFGQVIVAIRDNEARATSLGYDVGQFKLIVFVLSAALAGLAGSMKAVLFGVVTLTDVHWHLSGGVVLMTLLGGLGTVIGPIVGAFTVVLLENELGEIGSRLVEWTGINWFSTLGESVTIVTGLIFMVCVLLFRRGIVGEIVHHLTVARLRPRRVDNKAATHVPADWVGPPP